MWRGIPVATEIGAITTLAATRRNIPVVPEIGTVRIDGMSRLTLPWLLASTAALLRLVIIAAALVIFTFALALMIGRVAV